MPFPTCTTFTWAYLRHLFVAEEPLAHTLACTPNLALVLGLVARLRGALADGTHDALKPDVLGRHRPRARRAHG
jgi:queuine tRNA-ribosyltransferase